MFKSLKDLSDLYLVRVEPNWVAINLNLNNDEGFAKTIQHIEQTFQSNSGIKPDEYFDEINKDHYRRNRLSTQPSMPTLDDPTALQKFDATLVANPRGVKTGSAKR